MKKKFYIDIQDESEIEDAVNMLMDALGVKGDDGATIVSEAMLKRDVTGRTVLARAVQNRKVK